MVGESAVIEHGGDDALREKIRGSIKEMMEELKNILIADGEDNSDAVGGEVKI